MHCTHTLTFTNWVNSTPVANGASVISIATSLAATYGALCETKPSITGIIGVLKISIIERCYTSIIRL